MFLKKPLNPVYNLSLILFWITGILQINLLKGKKLKISIGSRRYNSLEFTGTSDRYLVNYIIDNLDYGKYKLLSPQNNSNQSTLVVISHRDQNMNKNIYDLLKSNGVDIVLREGNLRISPHIFNQKSDIEKLLELLKSI